MTDRVILAYALIAASLMGVGILLVRIRLRRKRDRQRYERIYIPTEE